MVSLLKTWFINLKYLSFTYWSLCFVCAPQFNSGQHVRKQCLLFGPCPQADVYVQQWVFMESTRERLRAHSFSYAQATTLQKLLTLLFMRLKIHRCLVNSDYTFQAENTSLIQTVFSSISDGSLAGFTQSFVFSYSRLLITATSSSMLFLPTSLSDVSVTVTIAGNCTTKYFILG